MVNSRVIISLLALLLPFQGNIAKAQVIPDNSLGNESSVVTELQNRVEQISGGAARGNNLFHSFLEFSIGEGASVYFANPEGIVNIFSRVTGNNISDILGTLGVNGNANLFLINPNGIMFGPNSSLDISGSFVATSASGVMFDNGTEFSATNPQAPPLLTVTTTQPIGLVFEGQPGRVMGNLANWDVPKGETLALVGGEVDLEGVSLSAPGGRIELGGLNEAGVVGLGEDFSLSFPEGVDRSNISLSNGTVLNVQSDGGGYISINAADLDISGESEILAGIAEEANAPQAIAGDININATANISINNSFIFNDVLGVGNGGSLEITAKSVEVLNGTKIGASTFGNGDAKSIIIQATEIRFEGFRSGAFSTVESEAEGNAGGVEIIANSVEVRGEAVISTNTFGNGDTGSITIAGKDKVRLDGGFVLSQVATGAVGNAEGVEIIAESVEVWGDTVIDTSTVGNGDAGGVGIIANSVEVIGGAIISTNTYSKGDSGSVRINATEVRFDGEFPTGAFSQVNSEAEGNAGGVEIIAESVEVSGGAQLNTSTFGFGDSGSVRIEATGRVRFDGEDRDGNISGAFSRAAAFVPNSVLPGKQGGVEIIAESVEVSGGAQISASTFGVGDAGSVRIEATGRVRFDGVSRDSVSKSGAFSQVNPGAAGFGGGVTIIADSVEVLNGAVIDTSTFGEGDAGSVRIEATKVRFDGEDSRGSNSGAFSGVGAQEVTEAVGNAGGVEIIADSVEVLNGAFLDTSTFGEGDEGSVRIEARKVRFDGEDSQGNSSGAFSRVGAQEVTDALGNAGGVAITTDSLKLLKGAQLSASTFGEGDAGSVTIQATEIIFDGVSSEGFPSAATSRVEPETFGNAGGIEITTDSLFVLNGAFLSTSTFGEGEAGSVTIQATEIIFDGGDAFSQVEPKAVGNAGGVAITTDSLKLLNGTQLSASTLGEGDAGSVTIQATEIIFDGVSSEGFSSGVLSTVQPDAVGNAGGIEITTDSLFVLNGAVLSTSTFGEGDAGTINITTNTLEVLSGSQIQTNTLRSDNAGNINIRTRNSINITGNNSGIFAKTEPNSLGNAGTISIHNPTIINISENASIAVNSQGTGTGGNIIIDSENINLNQGTISAQTTSGEGGNITLTVNDTLAMAQQSQISTTAGEEPTDTGNGGNITLNPARFVITKPDENSDITANAWAGNGGNIVITTEALFGIQPREELTEFSDITASSESGVDGEITINRISTDPTILVDEIPGPTENITFLEACSRGRRGKIELFDLGRGGMPVKPEDPLRGTTVIAPWIPLSFDREIQESATNWREPSPSATSTSYTIFVGYGCQE